jgi:hypothetical protein
MKKNILGVVLFAAIVVMASSVVRAEDGSCSGGDVGYEKNFYAKSCDGNYSLNVKGRMQLRYAGEMHDDDGVANANAHSLLIRRARLDFSGNVITPDLTYDLQLDLGAIPGAADNNILYYAWMNYKVMDQFQLMGGLHKIWFNRQEITSSGKQQFVDRSLANERFNLDRSIGVIAHGDLNGKMVEYYLSVVNGRNTRNAINTNQELGYIGRIAFNPLGEYGYEEADVKESEDVALTFGGAGGLWHEESTVGAGVQNRVISGNADFGIKYSGFSTQGEFFLRNTQAGAASQNDMGYYVQAGYFLVPKHFEIALRHSGLWDDTGNDGINLNMNNGSITGLGGVNDGVDETADSDNEYEYTAGLNYYFKGHDLKIQAQYSLIMDGVAGANDLVNHIAMLQTQLVF